MIAKSRVQRAMKRNIPTAAVTKLSIWSNVLVYREKERELKGPFTIMDVSWKMARLFINGKVRKFSIDKRKPFRRDDQTPLKDVTTLTHEIPEGTDLKAIDKTIDDLCGGYDTDNVKCYGPIPADDLHQDMSTFMKKIVQADDHEAESMKLQRPKEKKMKGLLSRSVFEPVLL